MEKRIKRTLHFLFDGKNHIFSEVITDWQKQTNKQTKKQTTHSSIPKAKAVQSAAIEAPITCSLQPQTAGRPSPCPQTLARPLQLAPAAHSPAWLLLLARHQPAQGPVTISKPEALLLAQPCAAVPMPYIPDSCPDASHSPDLTALEELLQQPRVSWQACSAACQARGMAGLQASSCHRAPQPAWAML